MKIMPRMLLASMLLLGVLQTPAGVMAASASKTFEASVQGDSGWTPSAIKQPGQSTQFLAQYTNNTKATQKQAYFRANPPEGSTVDEKSITLFNPAHPKGTNEFSISSDGTGVKLGTIKPGKTAYLQYSMTLPSAAYLKCGVNTLSNQLSAVVPEVNDTYSDAATIKITKKCAPAVAKPVVAKPAPAKPVYACNGFDINNGSGGSAGFADIDYTAQNGAAYKSAIVNWGDGSQTVYQKDSANVHVYDKTGTYTVRTAVTFTIANSNTTTSATCTESITITDASLAPPSASSTPSGQTTVTNTVEDSADVTPTDTTTAVASVPAVKSASTEAPAPAAAAPAATNAAAVTTLPNTGAGVSLVLLGSIVVASSVGYHFWLRRRA